jgi:hypothetical protein
MPVHDWTRVGDGIFHDFHHSWIEETKRVLNTGLLLAVRSRSVSEGVISAVPMAGLAEAVFEGE